MPATDNSNGLSCATFETLAHADFAAQPRADIRNTGAPLANGRPDAIRVVDKLPEVIVVTAKEISAIEMFLGASLDRLLSE